MQLIVGLGNPGEKYEHTPHNVGFVVTDALPIKDSWQESTEAQALFARLETPLETLVIKPLTMMNNSGMAVSRVMQKHKVHPKDVLIVHDDLDVARGEIKMTFGKSAAKHNGVASVIEKINTQNFWRLRIGIVPPTKPPAHTMKKFVLRQLVPEEEQKLLTLKDKMVEGILSWAENHEGGMQFINTN